MTDYVILSRRASEAEKPREQRDSLENVECVSARLGPIHETEREELLRSSVSDNILYTDPSSQTHGLQELMVRIGAIAAEVHGRILQKRQLSRASRPGTLPLDMYDKDGRAFVKGSSFGRFGTMADSFRQRASSKHRRTRLERTACPALDGCPRLSTLASSVQAGGLRRSGLPRGAV